MQTVAEVEQRLHSARAVAFGDVMSAVMSHPDVYAAIQQTMAGGVSFLQILMALLPFVLQILGGGKIDWQGIITAILALLIPPSPAPSLPAGTGGT